MFQLSPDEALNLGLMAAGAKGAAPAKLLRPKGEQKSASTISGGLLGGF